MTIFDHEAPEQVTQVSYAEQLMQAHAAAHPGFEGPEIPQSGNRYTLPDADGKPVTWNGATTLAAELDNPYAIHHWQLRQAVHGVGIRSDLAKLAGAAKPDDKDVLRKVVKDALAAAATEAGANEGTAWHMAFERTDRGEPIEALPEYFHKGIRARQECLALHGIEILPEYIERAVRCLMFKVSGKLDRIGRYEGQYVIIDDKSETDPLKYPKAKTIQMSIYAYAGELFDPATFTIEPMPDVRKDIAIMLHFDKITHECNAYRVPIDLGWWGARLAREVREWRKMDCLIAPLVSLGSWQPKPVTAEGSKALRNVYYGTVEAEETVLIETPEPAVSVTGVQVAESELITSDDGRAVQARVTINGQGAEAESAKLAQRLTDGADDSFVQATTEVVEALGRKLDATEFHVPKLSNGEPAIDPEAEAIELSTAKTKPELQQLCEWIGLLKEHLRRHRKPLADMYIRARNELGLSEVEAESLRAQNLGPRGKQQEFEVRNAQNVGLVEESEPQLEVEAGFQKIPANSTEEALVKIDKAMTKEDLQAIWQAYTDEHGRAAWTTELTRAGKDRLKVVERMQTVGAGNPFAD